MATGALGQTALTTTGVQTVTGTKTFNTSKFCLAGSTSGTICVNAPAIAGSTTSIMPVFTQQITFAGPTAARTVTLPDAAFTAARTDAAQTFIGVQTFSSAPVLSTTSDTQVLYNDGGSTAGSSNLVFDKAVKKLTIGSGGFNILGSASGSTTVISRTGVTATVVLPGSSVALAGLSSSTAGLIQFGSGTAGLLSDTAELQWNNSTKQLSNSFGGAVGDIGAAKQLNGDVTVVAANYSTGSIAQSGLYAQSSGGTTSYAALQKFGSGFTTSGLRVANGGYLFNDTAQFLIGTTANAPVIFAVNGSGAANEVLRINASDLTFKAVNFVLDTTTGTKIGTAASQKIGLWNATPIVQPTTAGAAATFVTNTSGTVNDTATFDGYTIGQVVKALRNAGFLQ